MNLVRRIALAAVLAVAAAAPAMADEWWMYRGGPKAPPSLTSPDYVPSDVFYGAYGGPADDDAGPSYGYR